MATTAPHRETPLLRVPPIRDYGTPSRLRGLPDWAVTGGFLVVLLALSGFIRAHYLTGQLWSDEANTVATAARPLGDIPGVLWHGGGAPLYFLILHVWISLFGDGEAWLHVLSVLFGLSSIPLALWLGWSLFGRRAGYLAALLFAFNAYLTQYAEEVRPYELLAVLGLLATGAFVHAFVFRHRRGWLPLFAIALALLAYTDAAGVLLWAAAGIALVPLAARAEDRRGLVRDAALAFGGALVLFAPWLPTLIHQVADATAPWHFAPLLGANEPRQTLGSDRVDAVFALGVLAGLAPMLAAERRRSRETTAALALLALSAAGFLVAGLGSIFAPIWIARYFGPIVAPLLMLAALGCARSGIFGLVAAVITCAFLANAASFIATYKSDMSDVGAELSSTLRPGDTVLVAQPEQAALAAYYLPGGLRFATALGADPRPGPMDWDGALSRLRAASPAGVVARLVARMSPGQHLVYLRPLTEGAMQWTGPWSQLVRRRAAQLGGALAHDPRLVLQPGTFTPHYYRSACCVASSALVYRRR
jgi:hypothetical protein